MAGGFSKKQKDKSVIKSLLADKQSDIDNTSQNLKFSFEDYCPKQQYASTFLHWQNVGLLSKALETLHGYSSSPITYDTTGKCTLYNDFPKSDETLFDYPKHVTPDASWVRIHVTGPSVIIGHVVRNTFYVVFLDKTHKFFLTKKVREKHYGKKALKPANKSAK
jgi:hypothetical protein